eukprot:TRINITY_DN951_c0_g1_i2.p1 TRINITY_DN951_c0_g1~~TRINITY_DN951_c0_g1_i2.p1  ORF type:complete len:601 (+),score=107.06 TRINITY_DN951_c0_g1_i2:69-1805(+)
MSTQQLKGVKRSHKTRRIQLNVVELMCANKKICCKYGAFVEIVLRGQTIKHKVTTSLSYPNDGDIFWEERFDFVVENDEKLNLVVCCKALRKDGSLDPQVVGVTFIELGSFGSYMEDEGWYVLESLKSSRKKKKKMRLEIRYEEDIVLVGSQYEKIVELMKDIDVLYAFSLQVPHVFYKDYAAVLLKQLPRDVSVRLIERLIEKEVKETEDESVLFRGVSLGSILFEQFLHQVGNEWRSDILSPMLEHIERGGDAQIFDQGKDARMDSISTFLQRGLNKLFNSADSLPAQIKYLLGVIRQQTYDKFGDEEKAMVTVSSFIFLRFINPAILNPKMFNLVVSLPTSNQKKELTTISSFLQKLGNMSIFRETPDMMFLLNDLLTSQYDNIVSFLETVSTPVMPSDTLYNEEEISLDKKQAAIFTRFLIKIRSLRDKSMSGGPLDPLVSELDRLICKIHIQDTEYWKTQHDFAESSLDCIQNILFRKDLYMNLMKEKKSKTSPLFTGLTPPPSRRNIRNLRTCSLDSKMISSITRSTKGMRGKSSNLKQICLSCTTEIKHPSLGETDSLCRKCYRLTKHQTS